MLDGPPDLSETGLELFTGATELLRKELSPERLKAVAGADGMDTSLWAQLEDMGWFRLLLPEVSGGFGLGFSDVGALFLAVGEHPVPAPVTEHVVVLPLVAAACGEGVDRLLGSRDGDGAPAPVVAFADPELDAVAVRRGETPRLEQGSLRGAADVVPYGALATDLLVVAQRNGQPALVSVSAGAEGVEVAPVASMDPLTRYGRVRFDTDAVEVLLAGSEASALLERLRDALRLSIACELSGLASRLATMAAEYARIRQQFGKPIAAFQSIKHLLADMAVRVNGLRNLCTAALARWDEPDNWTRSAVAKAHAAGVARSVALDALQIHGGVGFTMEHDLHLYLKRVHSLQGVYGDERELAEAVGRRLLAAPGHAATTSTAVGA